MTPVWSMISTKGGCGKTTTAMILASELLRLGKRVTMIDADPNGALLLWQKNSLLDGKSNLPEQLRIVEDVDRNGGTIRELVESERAMCDLLIIDNEGTNNRRATIAAALSSLCIIPVTSGIQDAHEAIFSAKFVEEAAALTSNNIPAIIVRVRVSAAIVSGTDKAVTALLHKAGVNQANIPLHEKAAFTAMMTHGCTLPDLVKFTKTSGLAVAQQNAVAFLEGLASDAITLWEKQNVK